jgi:hypothetical protein
LQLLIYAITLSLEALPLLRDELNEVAHVGETTVSHRKGQDQ